MTVTEMAKQIKHELELCFYPCKSTREESRQKIYDLADKIIAEEQHRIKLHKCDLLDLTEEEYDETAS